MKKTLFILICSSLVLCFANKIYAQSITLKVMTINLKESGKLDNYNLSSFVEFIRTHQPDVIALQEVDYLTTRCEKKDAVTELAAQLGMFPLFGKAISYDSGFCGVGILSKFPLLNIQMVTANPPGSKESRTCAIGEILLPSGRTVRIGATHMDHSTDQVRITLIASINKVMIQDGTPCLLLGDFNADPVSSTILDGMKSWQDFGNNGSSSLMTFPNPNPTARIDYIFGFPKTWKVNSFQTFSTEIPTSDHCPILAEVQFE